MKGCVTQSWRRLLLVGCLALLCLSPAAQAADSPATPGVKDLDTPRDFPSVATKEQWLARAKEVREQILVSCGLWPMPEKTPLDAHVFGKVERQGYSVEKVYFRTYPGFY